MNHARIPAALCLLLLAAGLSQANPIPVPTYGWEDGGTVLGLAGTGVPPILATNVAAPAPVWLGNGALQLVDNSPTGTPQAFVAFLWNLREGDSVYAGFVRYDVTPGTAPSCRIWGHWNNSLPADPDANDGSAGGNGDYGPEAGWDYTGWEWIVPAGMTGLVIEARVYSDPGDIVWIDEIDVMAPEHVFIQFPGFGPIGTEETTWGGVKALFR